MRSFFHSASFACFMLEVCVGGSFSSTWHAGHEEGGRRGSPCDEEHEGHEGLQSYSLCRRLLLMHLGSSMKREPWAQEQKLDALGNFPKAGNVEFPAGLAHSLEQRREAEVVASVVWQP